VEVIMSGQQAKVIALLRAEFAEEAAAGFSRLKRIPCTGVFSLLDYYASLNTAQQQALLDGLARFGSDVFFPREAIAGQARVAEMEAHPGFGPFYKSMSSSPEFRTGLRYTDVKMLVAMSKCKEVQDEGGIEAFYNNRATSDLAMQLRSDLVADKNDIRPAKSPLLRKLVDAVLKPLLPEKEKQGGGNFLYSGPLGSGVTNVWMDFGSIMGQLRYGVSVTNTPHTIPMRLLPFETLWFQHGGWDYLTQDNAERAIALLPELIEYLVRLADRINDAARGS
jgi:hypothetical protein